MAEAAKEVDVVRRGPRSVVPRLDQEMERFFRTPWPQLFDWSTPSTSLESRVPSVNVVDREDEVCVTVELPGFKTDDVEVSVNGSNMTIKAESKSETKEEKGDYYRHEISQDFMSRTVGLPAEVDGDKAKARLKNGMLEVTVPKLAKSKRHTVKVES